MPSFRAGNRTIVISPFTLLTVSTMNPFNRILNIIPCFTAVIAASNSNNVTSTRLRPAEVMATRVAAFDKDRMLLGRSNVGKITRLRVINANKKENGKLLIDPLNNDTVIDVRKFPANQFFNIEAVTSTDNGPIGSIGFTIKRGRGSGSLSQFIMERTAPYSVCGDIAGTFLSCKVLIPSRSRYTITATPYQLPNLKGVAGTTRTTSFTVADEITFPPIHVPTSKQILTPTRMPSVTPPTTGSASAAWIVVDNDAPVNTRHEACFLMVGRKAYLLGGRSIQPVNIYNPITRKWTNGTAPPKSIHHMQCVVVDASIWIVSSWTGGYPHETNNDLIYVRLFVTKFLVIFRFLRYEKITGLAFFPFSNKDIQHC